LLSFAIENQAAGCITACANLISPDLRKVWEAFKRGEKDPSTQEKINHARQVIERYPPLPSVIKSLLAKKFGLPQWSVCPPLLPTQDAIYQNIINQLILA
jgi:dihydrodipicolinate synthase/N-acetylneuraminate lyase